MLLLTKSNKYAIILSVGGELLWIIKKKEEKMPRKLI